jgi:hypothetical protein
MASFITTVMAPATRRSSAVTDRPSRASATTIRPSRARRSRRSLASANTAITSEAAVMTNEFSLG